MFQIKLLNSSYNHEVIELIKAFFPKEEVDEKEEKKYLIENQIVDNKIYTKLYRENRLVDEIYFINNNYSKNTIKNNIKKSIYEILTKLSNRRVPWGILTGIRPSKIVHNFLDMSYSEKRIKEILKKDYKIYDEKIDLIVDIVKNERKFIYPLDRDKYSIYISIPFCPTTCLYCSFPSLNIKRYNTEVENYIELLLKEIEEVSKYIDINKISTVYIGGGTPTSINKKYLEMIINKIYKIFPRDNIKEFTIEAGRPDTITEDKLRLFSEYDIDRISINPQTMNDSTLKLIGRNHLTADIERVYYKARELGNYIINMDMIVGLPSEGMEEIEYSMEKILKLNPDNLTVHTLSVKKGSRFKDSMEKYTIEDENIIEDMLDITREYAKSMDMSPYYLYRQKQSMGNFENIGYGKKDLECIYNILMMEERETIYAFGMGAVSKIFNPDNMKIKRIPNVKSLEEYINRNDEMIKRKIIEIESL